MVGESILANNNIKSGIDIEFNVIWGELYYLDNTIYQINSIKIANSTSKIQAKGLGESPLLHRLHTAKNPELICLYRF